MVVLLRSLAVNADFFSSSSHMSRPDFSRIIPRILVVFQCRTLTVSIFQVAVRPMPLWVRFSQSYYRLSPRAPYDNH